MVYLIGWEIGANGVYVSLWLLNSIRKMMIKQVSGTFQWQQPLATGRERSTGYKK